MKTTIFLSFATFTVLMGCVMDAEDVDDERLPFLYYLSDAWSEPEAEVIREAARTWERLTCLTLFEDGGWAPHDGGWTVGKGYDDKYVVYPFSAIDTNSDIAEALRRTGGFAGYYAGDILLMRSAFLRAADGRICFYNRDGNELRCVSEEEAMDDFVFQFNLDQLRQIAIHEFGHALGLRHNDGESSAMGSGAAPEEFFSREPTAGDIRNVCGELPCPAECPTRP